MTVGQQLTPTLRLVRPLAQGAMGTVWIADHLGLSTQVAVKLIAGADAQAPESIARFRREATAAQIKSPHVAQVFDHGVTTDGTPYIVMELLEGETLKARIARLGPLPLAEVARVVGQTAKALGRAHHLQIVHRDIKPENVFLVDVEGEPFVKVLDFGIAKQLRGGELGMTSTGSMLGTPFFMSPEQLLSSKHVDARADLWALAVLTYQALTGRLPFTGETLGALSVAVHTAVFTPPSALRPGLPPALDAWMARALQREVSARFGSAREMAEALAAALDLGERAWGRAPMGSAGDPGAQVQPAHESGGSGPHGLGGSGPHGLGGSGPHGLGGSGPHGLGGSGPHGLGVHGRTLEGVEATGAARRSRRAPLVIAAALVGGIAVTGVGVFLVMRGGSGEGEARVAGPEAAASTRAAGAEEPSGSVPAASSAAVPSEGEVPAPSASASPSAPTVSASAPAPAPLASASDSRPAPAVSPPVAGGKAAAAGGKPASAAATVSPPPTAAPRATATGKKKDDVGF